MQINKEKENMGKNMKIFISHSVIDKDVAKEFKDLIVDFGKSLFALRDAEFCEGDVFLSSDITSEQRKDDQWKKNFEKYLGDQLCTHFLILVSPDSLHSRWVQYEIGYASALNKKIIPIGIKGVSPEGFLLRDNDVQMIEAPRDLKFILKLVFDEVREVFLEMWYKSHIKEINSLIEICKERCVYFVGSNYNSSPQEWKQDYITDFLKQLTKSLLVKGIKVSSFPTVVEVGGGVCEEAMNIHPKMYEISGLYNFDKLFEQESMKRIPQNTWKDILRGFRRLYLENKSGMIIIGGGPHTEDEYNVAEEIAHLEIFPIRCLGGFGEDLFYKNIEKYKKMDHPCVKCEDCNLPCKQIDVFVKRLGHYNYINEEDERKS